MLKLSTIFTWALPLLGLYAGYCGLLFVFQRSLVFPGAGIRRPPALDREYPQRQVIWLETSFGRVECWYFPVPSGDGSTPAVIIAHGNAETISDLLPAFLHFNDLGLAVLLVEYPGYGRSEGSPSQDTVTEAFVTAYDSLAARPEIDASRISACGRSLGGAAACVLAEERPLASLILLSTFTSLRSHVPTVHGAGYAGARSIRQPVRRALLCRARTRRPRQRRWPDPAPPRRTARVRGPTRTAGHVPLRAQ